MGGFVWVTLATNDSYSLGALVLAHSLRKVGTAHKLAVLITPAVSPSMRDQLGSVYDVVKIVDVLDSKDEANLALLKRPELGITFTKLHCWQLTEFEKGVFLDADTLVIRNCDELFDRDEFSAAPDVGWPDCFNSGVFVFRPAVETFNNLIQFAVEKGSFDGGDQGLLNQFFSTWATDDIKKHLPFVYNLTSVAVYSYKPAFKQYGSETRIVHFIGAVKPWLQPVDPSSKVVTPTADSEHLQPLLQQWWDLFIEKVHAGLSTSLDCDNGLLPFFAQLTCSTDPLDSNLARSDPPPQPLEPSFPEPYTPYIEKDDERQYNLPYQPFQVVSSEGELLNITFSDFARDSDLKLSEVNEYEHIELEYVEPEIEEEEVVEKEQSEEQPIQEDQPYYENNYVEDQFNYHSFVPDESCIQAYLEHNIQEYQPRDYSYSSPYQPPQESTHWEPPALPRFLTIPQDDQRQSNQAYVREESPDRYWSQEEQQQWVPWELPVEQNIAPAYEHIPARAPSPAPPVHQPNESDHTISRSKSMTNLVIDATNATSFNNLTSWKSQPDVSIETPKKLPGLKPLIPKENTPAISHSKPKFTESTEVHMINTWSDPLGPPVDTMGFVERAIMKRTQSQKNLFDIPQGALEPNIPVISSVPILPIYVPQEINEYVDLLDCKRQAGNKPKHKELKPENEEKLSRRRSKRSVRRAADKWKPPETVEATYDVDLVMKKLSELSSGYTPEKLPEKNKSYTPDFSKYRDYVAGRAEISNQGLASFDNLVSNGNVETAADRLFRDSMDQLEEKSKNIINKNVLSHSSRFIPITMKGSKKKSKKDKKGVTVLKPFAALPGESLSELDNTIPEIVVCVASPENEGVPDHGNKTSTPIKAFDETYILDSDTNSFKSPNSEKSNSIVSFFESTANTSDGGLAHNGSMASDDTFKSAKSNFSPEIEIKTNNLIQSDKMSKNHVAELNDLEKNDSIIQRLSKLEINDDFSSLKPHLSAIFEETIEAENTIILESQKSEETEKLKYILKTKLTDNIENDSVESDISNFLSPMCITNITTTTTSKDNNSDVITKAASAAPESGDKIEITTIVPTSKQLVTQDDKNITEMSESRVEKLVKKELFSKPPEVIDSSDLSVLSNEPTIEEKENIQLISIAQIEEKAVLEQLKVLSMKQDTASASKIEALVENKLITNTSEVIELKDVNVVSNEPTKEEKGNVDFTSIAELENNVSEQLQVLSSKQDEPVSKIETVIEKEVLANPSEVHEFTDAERKNGAINENVEINSSSIEEKTNKESIIVTVSEQKYLSSNDVSKENGTETTVYNAGKSAENRSFSPPGVIEVSTNFKVVNTSDLNKSIEVEIAEDSLKFDFDKLVSDVVALNNLKTSSSSENAKPLFNLPENVKTPVLSYASAAKKESSQVPIIESLQSTSPKPTLPKSPTQSNGLKPKKTLKPKVKPVPLSTQQSTVIQPTKVVKRKAEKMDVEYPSNRFELLPKEIEADNDNHKKKVKKVIKRYLNPSTTNSLPPPLTISIVEEDTQLYLGEPDDNPGIAGAIAQLNLDSNPSVPSEECSAAQAEYLRRQSWETGKMDYMGRDSFENVLSKINETISQQPLAEDFPLSSNLPHSEYHPVSLSMILDCESIETLPADIMTLPVEAADDDIIFNRQTDCNVGLPEIKEEVEEPDEEQIFSEKIVKIQVIEEKSSEIDNDIPSDVPQKIVIFTTPPTPLEESVKILSGETLLPDVKDTSSAILKSEEEFDQNVSVIEDSLNMLKNSSVTVVNKELENAASSDKPERVITEEVLSELTISDINSSTPLEVKKSETGATESNKSIQGNTFTKDTPSVDDCENHAKERNISKDILPVDDNLKSPIEAESNIAKVTPSGESETLALETSISKDTLLADVNLKSLIEAESKVAEVTLAVESETHAKEITISKDILLADDNLKSPIEAESNVAEVTPAGESETLAKEITISKDNSAGNDNLKSSPIAVEANLTPANQFENQTEGQERTLENESKNTTTEGNSNDNSSGIGSKSEIKKAEKITIADQSEITSKEVTTLSDSVQSDDDSNMEKSENDSSIISVDKILKEIEKAEMAISDQFEIPSTDVTTLPSDTDLKMEEYEIDSDILVDKTVKEIEKGEMTIPDQSKILSKEVTTLSLNPDKDSNIEKSEIDSEIISVHRTLKEDEKAKMTISDESEIPSNEVTTPLSDNDSKMEKSEKYSLIISVDKIADSNLSFDLDAPEITDPSLEKAKISQTPSNSPSLDFQECIPSDMSQSDVIRDSPLPLIGSESSSAFAAYKPITTKDKNIVEPTPVKRQTSTEESKEKKGMFTKILEFVGVVKKKDEPEASTAVFYDEVFENKPEEIPVGGVEGIQNILKATDLGTIEDVEVSKKRSPSPRINIPKVPHTHITAATPPTTPAQKPARRDSEALSVDLTILETPPVVEKKTSILEETKPVLDRDEIITEIDNIIEKAKLIAEDQLDSYDPLYAKVIKKASRMGMSENPKPPLALCEDFEELKVTKNEDRKRPKDNVTSSKLAGQILKAIPPPRRRPISDARSSPEPENSEQKEFPDNLVSESAPNPPPVPPRRNRSRQRNEPTAPPKRKPKK